MEKDNSTNTNNPNEKALSRRNFLALTAAAGAGILLESQVNITSEVKDTVSDGVDHMRRMFDKPEREVAHEEVLPVLFEEGIKKLMTPEGQALFNVSTTDEEWAFAREKIENDTGQRGPYGEGSIFFGINDSEDGLTEQIYYSQMFSVKDLIEVWVVREKDSGDVVGRGIQFGLPERISDEEDVVEAMERFLAIPDEAVGRGVTDMSFRNVQGFRMLEHYELSGWDNDDVNHSVEAFDEYMFYSSKQRDDL